MSPFRLLCLDLDGTVLDSGRRVRPRTLESLQAAVRQGVTLAVVTGRSVGAAQHFMRWLGSRTGRPPAGAACNGAAVWRPGGETIALHAIDRHLLLTALDLLREHGLAANCYTGRGIVLDRPGRTMSEFLRGQERAGGGWLGALQFARINRVRLVFNLRRWAERTREPVLKIFAFSRGGGTADHQLAEAAAAVAARLPGLHLTSSGPGNLELTAPGVHKGRAVGALAAALQIPREAVMAVGDGLNDREMLAQAGLGVAMANGAPELRRAAGWVAPSCDEDGVAAAIERFIFHP